MRTHELQEKAKPYTVELRRNWDRLKKSVVRTQARLKVAASEACRAGRACKGLKDQGNSRARPVMVALSRRCGRHSRRCVDKV